MVKINKAWKPEGPLIVPLTDHPEWRNDPRAMTIYVGLNSKGNGPGNYTKKYVEGEKVKTSGHPEKHLAYVALASGIEDVAAILTEMARTRAAIVIRGAVREQSVSKPVLNRRWKPNPKGTPDLEHRLNHTLMADLDSVPAPTDFNWLENPARAGQFAIEQYLPIPFHKAAFYCELSASAGVKSRAWMNLHLWFWMVQPVGDDSLKEYFEAHNYRYNKGADLLVNGKRKGASTWPVDVLLFQPMQPHFSGYPWLIDTANPAPCRTALVMDGRLPAVILPMTVVVPSAPAPAPAPATATATVVLPEDIDNLKWECKYDGIQLTIEELRAMLPFAVQAYTKAPDKGRDLWWKMAGGLKHYLVTVVGVTDEGDPSPAFAFVDAEFSRKLPDFDEARDAVENERQWRSLEVNRTDGDQAKVYRVLDMAERKGYRLPSRVTEPQEAKALEKALAAAAKLTKESGTGEIKNVLSILAFAGTLGQSEVLKAISTASGKPMGEIRDAFKNVAKQAAPANGLEKIGNAELLDAMLENVECWNTDRRNSFISIPEPDNAKHFQHYSLEDAGLIDHLSHAFRKQYGSFVTTEAVQKVLANLKGKAQTEGTTYPRFVRLANYKDAIYLDRYDKDLLAVEMTGEGWREVHPPVKMLRSGSGKRLPSPVGGGTLEELKQFLNFGSEWDFRILVLYMVSTFQVGRPCGILILTGEQGTAKTTGMLIVKSTVDPCVAAASGLPKSEEDLILISKDNYVVTADNLSRVSEEQADMFCRLTTGGGLRTRKLYSNDTLYVFEVIRPVVFTGINIPTNRQDFLDRAITVELEWIPERDRKSEKKFWNAYDKAHPRILGAICDAVVGALKNLAAVEKVTTGWPRMADAVQFQYAACIGLGWNPDEYLEELKKRQKQIRKSAGESHQLSVEILAWLRTGNATSGDKGASATSSVWPQAWTGTPAELLGNLNAFVEEKKKQDREFGKYWPHSSESLGHQLRQQAAGLREMDVGYERSRDTGTRAIYLWLQSAWPDGRPDFREPKEMIKQWEANQMRTEDQVAVESEKRRERDHKARVADSKARGDKATPF